MDGVGSKLESIVFFGGTLRAFRVTGEILPRGRGWVGVDKSPHPKAKGEDNRRGKQDHNDNTRLLTHKGSADIVMYIICTHLPEFA